jgi:hypothetical protein
MPVVEKLGNPRRAVVEELPRVAAGDRRRRLPSKIVLNSHLSHFSDTSSRPAASTTKINRPLWK